MTRFNVLGPLEVWHAAERVPVPAGHARLLLATLLLRANRPVATDELIERLWPDRFTEPDRAKASLQMVVRRLRQALGGANVVRTTTGGYVAEIDPESLDLHRFRVLAANGEYAAALALWRGDPLSDVRSDALHAEEVAPLLEERLVVLERRIEADLAAGRSADLVPELRALTRAHPLRERLWGHLMLALYRSDRQAEALAAYREIRDVLAGELGVDPSAELQDLHGRILRAEDAVPERSPVPRQLPPDVAGFTGRREQLDALDDAAPAAGFVVITAVTGSAGIGKTALAVHWAHRVRPRFPDGQLFANLRGYDPAGPVWPEQVLARFLRALDVPAERIPEGLDEMVTLYRSLVADRRILVVLDNAASAEQVRPLLPGTDSCLVVVTSRSELRGLTAVDGARSLRLDVLTPAESAAFLRRAMPGAAPADLAELAGLCGHLPLAMRIAVANAAALGVEAYLAALRAGDRLSRLAVEDDPQSAVRAAFTLSYQALDDETRRVFRLLGVVPGPDFDRAAVTDLTGADAARALDRLTAANLVNHDGQGRFTLHDLVREYARELLGEQEAGDGRSRLFHGYLRRGVAAATVLYPHGTYATNEDEPDTSDFPDLDTALRWLETERLNILAAIADAAEHGPRRFAWDLLFCLRVFIWTRRLFDGWADARHAALDAARSEQDDAGRMAVGICLALNAYSLSRFPEAIEHYQRVIAIGDRGVWPRGNVIALSGLGSVYNEQGRLALAAQTFRQAYAVARESGSERGLAVILCNLGTALSDTGDLAEARSVLDQAFGMLVAACSPLGQALVLNALGGVCLAEGDAGSARGCQVFALELFRAAGHRRGETATLDNLALIARHLGDYRAAAEFAREGLAIAEETEDRWSRISAWNMLASVEHRTGDTRAAADRYRVALRGAAEVGHGLAELHALMGLALVEPAGEEALSAARRAVELASTMGARVIGARALTTLARVHRARGDREAARAAAESALATQREHGYRPDEVRTLLLLGGLSGAREARPLLERALELADEMGMPEADEARELLGRPRSGGAETWATAPGPAVRERAGATIARPADEPPGS